MNINKLCSFPFLGLVGSFLSAGNNFFSFIFLCVFFFPVKNVTWMNYLLTAATVISIPAIYFTKESYNRVNIDEIAGGDSLESDSVGETGEYRVLENEDELD